MFNNIKRPMEIGLSSFAETPPDVHTGKSISHAERLRNIIEEVELADQVGLDVYGVGEHHRADYASSRPATVLAAAATQTKNIKLTSAVTVLSSEDRSEEHTSELQSRGHLVCRLLLEKKKDSHIIKRY